MSGGVLSAGSQIATAGFTTPLPIIPTPQPPTGLHFMEHMIKVPTMNRRDKQLRNTRKLRRLLRRAARRNRASDPSDPCRMYAGVGSFLRIHHNGTVDGEKNPGDFSIVQLIGLATAIGLVRIKGEVSKNYLCMDRVGNLYGHPNITDECIFREHVEDNHYNYYSSHKYNHNIRRRGKRRRKNRRYWFVALNKNGTSRPGHRSRMDQIFTKFLTTQSCKRQDESDIGPFDTWQIMGPSPVGKINPTDVAEVSKQDEKEKKKRKRCKGKRRGKKCRQRGKKGKHSDKDKVTEKDKDTEDKKKHENKKQKVQPKKENETPCKRRWRNRKRRPDYIDEATARKRRARCRKRLAEKRLEERMAKRKEKKKTVESTPSPTVESTPSPTVESTPSPTVRIVTKPASVLQTLNPTLSTTLSPTRVPTTAPTTDSIKSTARLVEMETVPSTEVQTDLKSDRFSADFKSVFDNLIRAIQMNNKEMLSNFSSVNGGLLASMLRLGGQSGQGGSESTASGASFSEHKHRHHHGSDGRRRHERSVSDIANSDLNVDIQSSKTGLRRDQESDSEKDKSKPSVTSWTTSAKRNRNSRPDLLRNVFRLMNEKNLPDRTRPNGSKAGLSSDKNSPVLIFEEVPMNRPLSRRKRIRHTHGRKR